MMLPAVAARHWAAELAGQIRVSVLLAMAASLCGLLLSFHFDLPAGPAIVLSAGGLWAASLLAGPLHSLRHGLRRPHLAG
jgi:zinc/manganese transport system permease protein